MQLQELQPPTEPFDKNFSRPVQEENVEAVHVENSQPNGMVKQFYVMLLSFSPSSILIQYKTKGLSKLCFAASYMQISFSGHGINMRVTTSQSKLL